MKKNKNKKGVSAEQQRAVSTAHADNLDKESASEQNVYAVADENYAQLNTRFGGGSQDDDNNYEGLRETHPEGLRGTHPQESRPPMPLPKPEKSKPKLVVSSATATSSEVESVYDD